MNRASLALVVLVTLGLVLAPGGPAKTVNSNTDDLPPGCEEVSEEIELTVRGGAKFAKNFSGVAYTFDQHSFDVPACALVTVTFVNTDDIRHQFMPHGTWPSGFTLIEVDGPGRGQASFIAPANPTTLMVHCGVNQHQQKGMKAQFVVAGGVGDVPNIPGVSGLPPEDRPAQAEGEAAGASTLDVPAPASSLLVSLVVLAALVVRRRR